MAPRKRSVRNLRPVNAIEIDHTRSQYDAATPGPDPAPSNLATNSSCLAGKAAASAHRPPSGDRRRFEFWVPGLRFHAEPDVGLSVADETAQRGIVSNHSGQFRVYTVGSSERTRPESS